MKINCLLTIAFLLSLGCASRPRVHKTDLEAWTGQSLDRLEEHPFFNPLPVREKRLSDGRLVRVFDYCDGERCCHNQFYIKGKSIQKYVTSGSCSTSEQVLPGFEGSVDFAQVPKERPSSAAAWAAGLRAAGEGFQKKRTINCTSRKYGNTTSTNCY